jgi:EGF domain/Calcium-binding EGF domain
MAHLSLSPPTMKLRVALLLLGLAACNSGDKAPPVTACEAGCPVDTVCDTEGACVPASTMPPCALCDVWATCTAGVCLCAAGRQDVNGDGSLCADLDQCAGTVCGPHATCHDEEGSFTCTCDGGFLGDPYDLGRGCDVVNACGGQVCGANAVCADGACACSPGFTGDPLAGCTNVDECAAGTDDCDSHATCFDTTGSFTCRCGRGWAGDGRTCSDVDECLTANGGCDEAPLARCDNRVGSYACTCPAGYDGTRRCLPTGDGHVVLVAHDLVDKSGVAFRRLLVNALALGHGARRLGVFVEDAPLGTAAADAPLRLLGLGPSDVQAVEARDLAALYEVDVLLVPSQASAGPGEVEAVGRKYRRELSDFVYAGGVVVVLDHGPGDSAGLVRGAGLVDATLSGGSALAPIAFASDPVTDGVSAVPVGLLLFSTGDSHLPTDGREIVSSSKGPAVVHKTFHPLADFERAKDGDPGSGWAPLGPRGGKPTTARHGGQGWTDSEWFHAGGETWGSRDLDGDRLTLWFRPTSDAAVIDLAFNSDGVRGQRLRVDGRGAKAQITGDFADWNDSADAVGRLVVGGWCRIDVRWQGAIMRGRLTLPDDTRFDLEWKSVHPPAGVTFRVSGAEIDSLFGSAESR